MTKKECFEICKQHKYVAFLHESGYWMYINSRALSMGKNKDHKPDDTETQYKDAKPVSLNEYINHKAPYK